MPVRGGQLADVLGPVAHDPGEVAGVVQAPHHDAVQVHGLDEVAEQRTLQPQHVPPGGERGVSALAHWSHLGEDGGPFCAVVPEASLFPSCSWRWGGGGSWPGARSTLDWAWLWPRDPW